MNAFEHVWMCASVCLNVSGWACVCVCVRGGVWDACVCENRCSGSQPVAPFCSLSMASNHTMAQYSLCKLQLIPDLLSEQLPRVLWGCTASWTSSCPLTYSIGVSVGGGKVRVNLLYICVRGRERVKVIVGVGVCACVCVHIATVWLSTLKDGCRLGCNGGRGDWPTGWNYDYYYNTLHSRLYRVGMCKHVDE